MIYKNEEGEQQHRTNKIKKIEQACNNLYLTSFAKKEKQEMIEKEYHKIKTQQELENCPFKPKLILSKQIDGELLKLGFFERRDQIKQKISEK